MKEPLPKTRRECTYPEHPERAHHHMNTSGEAYVHRHPGCPDDCPGMAYIHSDKILSEDEARQTLAKVTAEAREHNVRAELDDAIQDTSVGQDIVTIKRNDELLDAIMAVLKKRGML